tara:strand:- start:2309 stop:3067 length:759 start_codon:yes stop_codon:yes gene_type:complete
MVDLIDNMRLDTAIMALSCTIVALVMFSFYRALQNVGSLILKVFFLLFGTFLLALSAFFVFPNIHTLLLSTFISIAGALLAVYMYKYILRYFKKTGVAVLPKIMKDLAVMNFLVQTTKISRKPKVNKITEKFSAKHIELIDKQILKSAKPGEPFYLDKEKKVKAVKENIDYPGMFFTTTSEPEGVITRHWHNINENVSVKEGDITIAVYMPSGEFKTTKTYRKGDTFPINIGTIHEVTTVNGYVIKVYFQED